MALEEPPGHGKKEWDRLPREDDPEGRESGLVNEQNDGLPELSVS